MPDKNAIIGSLLGTAVGDAMGLACEGLSKERQLKFFPSLDHPHFFFGRGMISDDTEHACMVAQSLIVSGGEEEKFLHSLAWRLRWWLLGAPAGIGFATLKSILKLWAGFSPHRSGVFSAGNGPAMRSAIIGVCYRDNPQKMRGLVRLSSRLTHSDPKAEFGAQAVALAAAFASEDPAKKITPEEYCRTLREFLGTPVAELIALIEQAAQSVAKNQSTATFASAIGQPHGVSGYTYHTVPVVLHAWFRHPENYREGITEIIRCGGDADTTSAILGGIIGARVGKTGIPAEWQDGICEWPRSISWMESVSERLADVSATGQAQPAMPLFVPGLLARNLFFAIVVLSHGFRRLAPPY